LVEGIVILEINSSRVSFDASVSFVHSVTPLPAKTQTVSSGHRDGATPLTSGAAQVRSPADELARASDWAARGKPIAALAELAHPAHQEDPDALELRARLSYQVGDNQGALAAAARVLHKAPDRAAVYLTKAMAHRDLGEIAEARAAFEAYLRSQPRATNAAAIRSTVSKL
jgi:Flp pilus assembly protein TadD